MHKAGENKHCLPLKPINQVLGWYTLWNRIVEQEVVAAEFLFYKRTAIEKQG
jgi:hypothetical protein